MRRQRTFLEPQVGSFKEFSSENLTTESQWTKVQPMAPRLCVVVLRCGRKFAVWEVDIRLQSMPLREIAIASPAATATRMVQPANTNKGARCNMTLSTNDLDNSTTLPCRNGRCRGPALVDTCQDTFRFHVDTNEGCALVINVRSRMAGVERYSVEAMVRNAKRLCQYAEMARQRTVNIVTVVD